ncbi:MAG: hypothetical protein JWN44_3320 [Myxococcales bacterium]|nr:hypothetical protein [Myxococcales bacterium]
MTSDVTISCPHCRRQYTMKVDPERLQRLKMRATCGRCGNSFDVGSRIAAPSPPMPKLDLSTLQRIPPPAPPPVAGAASTTSPDLADEMAELAREFADAAARFTPVGVRPSAAHAATIESPPPDALIIESAPVDETSPPAPPAGDPPASAPSRSSHSSQSVPSLSPGASDAAPTTTGIAASAPAPAFDATLPLGLTVALNPDDAADEFDADSITSARKNAKSWIDLADPGLAAFKTPVDPAAAALEALLSD